MTNYSEITAPINIKNTPRHFGVNLSQTIQTLIDRMPHKPYCSNDLSLGLSVKPKALALHHKYIQHNPPFQVQALVIDIDDDQAFCSAEDANVQLPSILVRNPENGHGHAIYLIDKPVTVSASARMKPMQWLAGIERGYTRRMKGDKGYTGLICRNPLLHPILDTSRIYSLAELDAPLDYSDKSPYVEIEKEHGTGRNVQLFDTVRIEAYAEVAQCANHDHLHSFVAHECDKVNTRFINPLGLSETKATAKSISKWTWQMRDELAKYKKVNRGAYGCSRAEVGKINAAKKMAAADAAISTAIQQLGNMHKKLSISAIARVAGVSRTTVYAFMKRKTNH